MTIIDFRSRRRIVPQNSGRTAPAPTRQHNADVAEALAVIERLARLRPSVVIALGRTAANLLDEETASTR
jgi:hypothetical protein